MAERYLLVDDQTGKKKLGAATGGSGGFVDEDFDVGSGGAVEFDLSNPLAANQSCDVFINGFLKREGATHDFVRNVAEGKIEMNFTVPQSAWVRVRIYG